ncbi:MAG: hypothetical protein L0Y54_07975 [Sporichthyaceae bacterium]|nr:hypothetical protein [Sporichthyaceae bacterium]
MRLDRSRRHGSRWDRCGRPDLRRATPHARHPIRTAEDPSDPQPTDVVAGRIVRGGSGPCYGLETDDGTQHALYSADGLTLEEGAVVRVRIEPLLIRIYCGPGHHVKIVKVAPVG